MIDVTVRDAGVGDAVAIARVHVASWRGAYTGIVPQAVLDGLDIARRADQWRRQLEGGGDADDVLVADRAGGVVGFASTGAARGESGRGELMALYVEPASMGAGVGGALLMAAEARLADEGFGAALLWVLEQNPAARAFYEHRGWSPDGSVEKLDFAGTPVAAVRYGKRLQREG